MNEQQAAAATLTLLQTSGLMLIGVVMHYITKLAALEENGQNTNPWTYVKAHPWRILNMLLACEMSIFLFRELGQLNVVTAVLTGYLCQSVSENMRKRAEKRMQALEP